MPNVPKIHQLKAQIASCKQDKQEVVEFFNRHVGLWNELENYVKISVCKCEAASKIAKFIEDDKAHQFLMGLDDDSSSPVRSQILALDSLPSLDKIFNLVQQEENHRRVMIGRDNKQDSMAVFAVSHQAKTQSSHERPTCTHCGKYGHEERNCYELVGYPAGWSSRGGRGGRGRARGGRGTSHGGAGRGRGG